MICHLGSVQRSSLPPDGTTFAHLTFGERQVNSIPAFSYWNMQVGGTLIDDGVRQYATHYVLLRCVYLDLDLFICSSMALQFHQSQASYVELRLEVSRGASIGLYARKNAIPSHTKYDLHHVLSGFALRQTRQSSQV